MYIVRDSEAAVSYHATLRSAQKRGDGFWIEQESPEGARQWRAGRTDGYHVIVTEERLWG